MKKHPTREHLIYLREKEGMTRDQIAEYYNVSLTTVRRWIREFNVPRPTKQRDHNPNKAISRNGEIIAPLDDGLTILERAEKILGDRLTEKRGMGYFLDGRPVNVSTVIKAAGLKYKDE